MDGREYTYDLRDGTSDVHAEREGKAKERGVENKPNSSRARPSSILFSSQKES